MSQGIPRSELPQAWSYRTEISDTERLGVGLPLSRLHVRSSMLSWEGVIEKDRKEKKIMKSESQGQEKKETMCFLMIFGFLLHLSHLLKIYSLLYCISD